jgi:hypothetical protein
MANDISGFGLRANLRASVTFPAGINITQFADDTDPFDSPELTQLEAGMGLNGDLLTWNTANPIVATISVIPGSEDDRNLAVLAESNRVARGKQSSRDDITLTVIYPDGSSVTGISGKITTSVPMKSIASAGRQKTRTYGFVFENKVEVNV